MCQTVDHCSSKLVVAKNGPPLSKFDIRGYDQIPLLIAICDDLKQQARSFDIEWHIAKLIKDHEFCS